MNNLILLDTHILLWLINGTKELSNKIREKIEFAAATNGVFVSAISIWEIGMLEAKGKISLSQPALDWVTSALKAPGMNLLPLSPKIAIESCNFKDFHGDPADRIIISSARIENLTLITRDKKILAYSKANNLKTITA